MRILKLLAVATLLLGSSSAFAGLCGGGKITHIEEGGWDDSNDFLIAIDYTEVSRPTGTWVYKQRYIRFKQANIDPDRFRGIKALAYMAFSTGASVRVFAYGVGCGNANNLRISLPGESFEPPILPAQQP